MSDPIDSFGKRLRSLRLTSGVGLRELARRVGTSPGYLSDVEQGNAPPPSEQVIIKIADALGVDKHPLLQDAKKIDPELTRYVADQPLAADFLRMAKNQHFDSDDWHRLTQLAKISRLGKDEDLET
jgi:transcriptional regulator with XRE-family HTH domain